MKSVKSVLFKQNKGIETFYNTLLELKKVLTIYAEQKVEMLEIQKEEIEKLLEVGKQLETNKALEAEFLKLEEANRQHKETLREKIKEIQEER